MIYKDIIRYVFAKEAISIDLIDADNKERELTEARQICMSLGASLLNVPGRELVTPFGRVSHATALHAKTIVKNRRETDKEFDKKYLQYFSDLDTLNKNDKAKEKTNQREYKPMRIVKKYPSICTTCQGSGVYFNVICPVCEGTKRIEVTELIEF